MRMNKKEITRNFPQPTEEEHKQCTDGVCWVIIMVRVLGLHIHIFICCMGGGGAIFSCSEFDLDLHEKSSWCGIKSTWCSYGSFWDLHLVLCFCDLFVLCFCDLFFSCAPIYLSSSFLISNFWHLSQRKLPFSPIDCQNGDAMVVMDMVLLKCHSITMHDFSSVEMNAMSS